MRTADPLEGARQRLGTIHQHQTHRDDWPDFATFEPSRYDAPMRHASARQWMRRAREELGSVYEFTAVAHGLARARVPVEILGSLSRLITDEVRHAELCGRMARAIDPEGPERDSESFAWPPPKMPFAEPPLDAGPEALCHWAAGAILCSCCIGETLSRPLFEACATVCTDPVCEAVLRQILRDEHLHATFGWEALAELLTRLGPEAKTGLQRELSRRLAGFERSCAGSIALSDLVDTEIEIAPGDPANPNLATLTREQYAMIFYSTLESVILPRFDDLGFDAQLAWSQRHGTQGSAPG